MVSHLPAMMPVAVGCALAFRIRDEKRVAVGWSGEGAIGPRRRTRGDELRRRPPAPRRLHLRQQPVGVLDPDAPRATPSSTSPTAPPRTASRESSSTAPTCSPSTARRRRAIEKARNGGGPTLLELQDAADGGPRCPRRRLLRPQGAVRGVGEERSGRALPHLAARERRADRRGGGGDLEPGQEAPERRALAARRNRRCPTPARCSMASTRRPRTSTRPTTSTMAEKTYLQAISDGLRQEMRRDERVFVIGEDVGVYGGAFKVTLGFQEEFGPWRVIDAPLAETAIVGAAHWRVDDGHAPRRRDAVRGLHLLRLGPPRHRRRQAALPRRHAGADRRPAPVRRRLLGRPVPLAEPGELVRAHSRPQVRLPGDAGGREGPARRGDRGSEPGSLLRAQAPLPADQGATYPTSATRPRSGRRARTSRATTSP